MTRSNSLRSILSTFLLPICLLALGGVACAKSEAKGSSDPESKAAPAQPKVIEVLVSENGYTPASVDAEADKPLVLRFKRTTDKGCGDKLVVPSRKIEKDLPLNKAVDVKLTPKAGESIAFTCGMGMYKGAVVVASN